VLAATSGETGLRIAGGQPRPDLILLDVMMPGMDGYEVLAELREQAATRDIPVIFLTALGSAEDEGRGLEMGAADYITKPLRPAVCGRGCRRSWKPSWRATGCATRTPRWTPKWPPHAENDLTQQVSIRALAHLAEMRDPETGNHLLRTQAYVRELAQRLRQPPALCRHARRESYIELLSRSAPLHDIGKVGIPDHILLKPGKLTPPRWPSCAPMPNWAADAIERAEATRHPAALPGGGQGDRALAPREVGRQRLPRRPGRRRHPAGGTADGRGRRLRRADLARVSTRQAMSYLKRRARSWPQAVPSTSTPTSSMPSWHGFDAFVAIARPWRSLQTRLTLLVLGLLLLALWTLAALGSRLLHADLERLVTDQQQAALTIFADELNQDLRQRLSALEVVARNITPALQQSRPALQVYLEQRLTFVALFNGGHFTTDVQGMVTASLPLSARRLGSRVQGTDELRQAVLEGRSIVGAPKVGAALGVPVVTLATPIRDAEGRVSGALVGVIDLTKPSFLDRVTRSRYGRTGGHLLVAPMERKVVTASDKSLVLRALAPAGADPVLDRLLSGETRAEKQQDEQGQDVLAAASPIPAAGWVLISQLPTREAFEPVHNLLRNARWTAAVISLLAVLGSAWIIRRQLAPMREATAALALQGQGDQAPAPLPVRGSDELAELIAGFNRLVATLGERERALRDSEYRWKFALEGAGDGLWDWDVQAGRTYYSKAWKSMLGFEEGEVGNGPEEWADRLHPDDRGAATAALDEHLQGRTEVYAHEHRMRARDGSYRWILGRGVVVARGDQGQPLRMLGTHTDISARRAAADAMRQSHELLMRVIDSVPARVFWKGTDLRYLGCNAAFANDAGVQSPSDVVGKRDQELGWAAQAEQYNADDRGHAHRASQAPVPGAAEHAGWPHPVAAHDQGAAARPGRRCHWCAGRL
jgi:PAS domain S-box-containing protein